MEYTSAAAFRRALEQRLKNEAAAADVGLARLRTRVAFELFLRRLVAVAPDRWVLEGALALDLRLGPTTRSTKDIDLGRTDDEAAAIRDLTAAQQIAMDDFSTFAAARTNELDETDEFSAMRFHVTAQLAGRTCDRFRVDVAFSDTLSWTPDTIHTSDLLPSPASSRSRFRRSRCRRTSPRRFTPTRAPTELRASPAPGRRISSTSC